uniref:Uncharacterized protein n=1 Tax=Hippocampus comes TaxID=109280 RepID=A0A3Q2YK77_HIPCM
MNCLFLRQAHGGQSTKIGLSISVYRHSPWGIKRKKRALLVPEMSESVMDHQKRFQAAVNVIHKLPKKGIMFCGLLWVVL